MCERCDNLVSQLAQKLAVDAAVWERWGKEDNDTKRGQATLEHAEFLRNLKLRIESSNPLTVKDVEDAVAKWY